MTLKHRLNYSFTTMTLASCMSLNLLAQPLIDADSPGSDLKYDLVVADIPSRDATIAAAALAELQIALYQAKKHTEQILCDGNWTPLGKALSETGPEAFSGENNDQAGWHYHSLRQAHPLSCSQVSRAQFFQEMSRHLPGWVVIRPAGQITAFARGEIYPPTPTSVASR